MLSGIDRTLISLNTLLLLINLCLIGIADASGEVYQSPLRPQLRSGLTDEPLCATKVAFPGTYPTRLGASSLSSNAFGLSDDEFSRQTIALGRRAQRRLMRSHVAVAFREAIDRPKVASAIDQCNSNYGLLDEVVRNLALSGLKRITLLGTPSLSNGSMMNVDSALERLHRYGAGNCKIDTADSASCLDVGSLSALIAVNVPLDDAIALDNYCRANSIKFVYSRAEGSLGCVFCDFGNHEFTPKSPVISTIDEVVIESILNVESNISESDRCSDLQLICAQSEAFRAFHRGSLADLRVSGSGRSLRCEVSKIINARTIHARFVDAFDASELLCAFNESGAKLCKVDIPQYVVHKSLQDSLSAPLIEPSNDAGDPEATEALSACQVSALFSLDKPGIMKDRVKFSKATLKRALGWIQSKPRVASPVRTRSGFLFKIFSWLSRLLFLNKINVAERAIKSLTRRLYASFASNTTSGTLNSAIAGISAQEVVKACTGNNKPISQFYTLESEISPIARVGDRSRLLVVGAGAVGCEVLKNLLYAGVATSPVGTSGALVEAEQREACIHVVDMDSIEKSNLNRQFLFRPEDVGRPKSHVAAEALQRLALFRNCTINVKAHINKLGRDVADSSFFDDSFWEKGVDVVVSAVDNLDGRMYLDAMCVKHRLPLVDVGTMGALGSVQVVLPGLTESYADSSDEETGLIPTCTIKSFPYKAEHCITWAKDTFDKLFNEDINFISELMKKVRLRLEAPEQSSDLRANDSRFAAYVGSLLDGRTDFELLQLKHSLECILPRPRSMGSSAGAETNPNSDYVEWALKLFFELFNRDVRSLIDLHPPGSLDDDGALFWSGSRARVPAPEEWPDFVNGYKLLVLREFVICAAILKARAHEVTIDPSQASDALDALEMSGGVEILRSRVMDAQITRDGLVSEIIELFKGASQYKAVLAEALVFDKDDLALGDILFVTMAATIRCHIYGISPPSAISADQALPDSSTGGTTAASGSKAPDSSSTAASLDPLFVRAIAGRIVPAILTTTAVVSSVATEEVLKILDSPYVNNRQRAGRRSFISPAGSSVLPRWMSRRLPPSAVAGVNRAVKLAVDRPREICERLLDSLRTRYRNAYINLAANSFGFSAPAPPVETNTASGGSITKWDFVEVPFLATEGTVEDLVRFVESRFPETEGRVESVLLLEEGMPIYHRSSVGMAPALSATREQRHQNRAIWRWLAAASNCFRLLVWSSDIHKSAVLGCEGGRDSPDPSIATVIAIYLAQSQSSEVVSASMSAPTADFSTRLSQPCYFRDLLVVLNGETEPALPKLRLYYF